VKKTARVGRTGKIWGWREGNKKKWKTYTNSERWTVTGGVKRTERKKTGLVAQVTDKAQELKRSIKEEQDAGTL